MIQIIVTCVSEVWEENKVPENNLTALESLDGAAKVASCSSPLRQCEFLSSISSVVKRVGEAATVVGNVGSFLH